MSSSEEGNLNEGKVGAESHIKIEIPRGEDHVNMEAEMRMSTS